MICPSCGVANGQSQLCSAATKKRLRQVFEGKVVNADHEWTRTKRWRRELHMQHVDRVFAKFGTECQWNSDQGSVWQRGVNFEVGPALMETIASFVSSDVESVIVSAIDLRERFDKINGVAFVSG
jgi:hypothetical protein